MAMLNIVTGKTPGLLAEGNIDLAKRPVVRNADGTISTVRSMSFNQDGREILVPTVSPDGQILSDQQAIERYRQTGENLGVFDTPDAATKYANTLHTQQEAMYDEAPKPVTVKINGRTVRVDGSFRTMTPEQQQETIDDIAKQIGVSATSPESDQAKAVREDLAATSNNFFSGDKDESKTLRKADSFIRGAADTASFGLADEIAASAERNNVFNPENYSTLSDAARTISNLNPATAVVNQIWSMVAPDEKAQSILRRERALQTQRDDIDSGVSTAGRISGALLGAGALTKAAAPYMASLPANATLGAEVAQGVKSGGLYSGLYGLGSGEGVGDRLKEGAKQALMGAAIGGAIPVVTAGVKAAFKPVTDAVQGYFRPEAYANRKIAERLANDLKTPAQAADEMARNPGMNLADVAGDNTKNLLKTAANVPGRAQSKINARLNLRQMQQGDRIKSVVRRTLAEPDGYLGVIDDINTTAREAAEPLFAAANDIPIPFTQTLEEAIDTPAGRRALATAERLAANEQQPFRQMFVNMIDDNTGVARRVPDVRGWEYIRQALDDMIDAQRDPMRGNRLTNEGRILVGLQERIFREVRGANAPYDQALQIWRGGHSLENAVNAGREVLQQSPEATRRAMQSLSEAERQAYRIGVATAIRDKIGGGPITNNALLKFFASKDQVESLQAAFPDAETFRAFRAAMFAEAKKRLTYNVVKGNSTSAKQLADMADAGGLKETADFAVDAVRGGITSATLKWIGSRLKILGGFTPEVADQVQRRLLTADPEAVRNITRELMRVNARRISADQRRQLVNRLITPMLAEGVRASSQQ